jgi:hypothetical protein
MGQAGQQKEKEAAIKVPTPWNRRLTLRLLCREAETLTRGAANKETGVDVGNRRQGVSNCPKEVSAMPLPSLWESLPSRSPRLGRGSCRLTRPARHQPKHRSILLVERLEERAVPSASWVEQGPGLIFLPKEAPLELPAQHNASTGAVEALAVNPANPNIAYAGSVNGGVWRTNDLNDPDPVWQPLTDQQLPSLNINSVAISPVNPNEIFAGTGTTSAMRGYGGFNVGIDRSLDGGQNWQVFGSDVLAGQSIRSIVPTTLDGGQVVLAASWLDGHLIGNPVLQPGGGVYRSTDGGVTWTQLSGAPGTGLPAESVTDLVADPGNPNRFYAAAEPMFFGHTGQEGVYRSDDGGQTWTQVDKGLKGLDNAGRILLAVHNSPAGNAVYAMVIDVLGFSGTLSGVFRSDDQGGHWTSMGTPPINIYQLHQGFLHGAMTADPNNPDVVYIAGDGDVTQPGVFEAASVMRGDASQSPKNVWTKLYCDAANNTSPHADSRAITFDQSGNLLYGSDGGVARLDNTNNPSARQWRFISTGLSDVEFHNVAYDPLSKVIIGGAQDNGNPVQLTPGATQWDATNTAPGDGGVVAIDADQAAHPGVSIRYNSGQFLIGFTRSAWDANNDFLGSSPAGLNIVAGPGADQNLLAFDPHVQFFDPFTLNTVDSSRLLIGTTSLYESFDRGDTLTNLNLSDGFPVGGLDGGRPMVYGGRLNGVANPGVIWAGTGTQIVYREHQGDPLQVVPGYHGNWVETIVADPQNYQHAFVVDTSGQVWDSSDAGQSFQNITANLSQLTPLATTLELVTTGRDPQDEMLVAGGLNGVFAMNLNNSGGNPWYQLGTSLPHAVVLDLHYSAGGHLLLAGTLGRGAWTLKNPFGDTDSSDGNGGGNGAAWSIPAASHATFSRPPGALDAFFAALAGDPPSPRAWTTGPHGLDAVFIAISGGPAASTHNAGAADDLRAAAAAMAPLSSAPALIPAAVATTPATSAAPPSAPASRDKVVTPPAPLSATLTSTLGRRPPTGRRGTEGWMS